jgi:hypothetical protein
MRNRDGSFTLTYAGSVRKFLIVAAASAALIAAPAARAATVAIQLDPTVGITKATTAPSGIPEYTAFFANAVLLQGTVSDDNGATPPAGTIVHLSTITHGNEAPKPLADVVTAADGSFSRTFVPAHSFSVIADVARPTDPVVTGLSAAQGRLVLGIGPNIQLTTKLVQRGQPYRIRGLIDIPHPRTAGVMLLKRRSPGQKSFHTIAAQRTTSDGRFRFAVRHKKPGVYRYQIIFRPKDGAVWLLSKLNLRVTFTRK